MFKIISKKRYEKLCRENDKLHKEVAYLRKSPKEENKHKANRICAGCKHLITIEGGYYRGAWLYDTFECELNRMCKDYVAEVTPLNKETQEK